MRPSLIALARRGCQHLLLALAGLLAAAPAVHATTDETLVIGFSNLYSADVAGSADNTTLTYWLAPGAYITGVTWAVQLTAYEPSWLSEMTLALTNSNGEGLLLLPAGDLQGAGSLAASGQLDLVNNGLAFRLRGDGALQLEFYEAVDDLASQPDGRWSSGQLHIAYTAPVPEPAAAALMLAGLIGVAALGRRRAGWIKLPPAPH